MRMRRVGPLLALVVGMFTLGGPASASPPRAAPAEPPHAPLYQNLYFAGQRVTSHVVLRSGEDGRPARIIVADPRANTGTGFWSEKLPRGTAGLRADGPIHQVAHHGIAGVQATMSGPSELRIKRYRLGSVRELRDTEQNVEAHTTAELRDAAAVLTSWGPQSDPTTEQVRQTMITRVSQWLAPERVVDPKNPSALVLQRHALGSGALYRTEFVPDDGTKIEMDGQDIVIKGDGRTHFKMRTFIDRPQLAPLDHLFASGNGGHMGKALRFLSSGEKLLAGSWQYLTYFGRDTMISAALLSRRASSEFMGMAVSSVLDRVSPEGIPAHEEDIGDQATLRNLKPLVERIRTHGASVRLTEKDLKTLETPIYDYKMIDGEFLLPQLVTAFVDKLDPSSPADAQVMKDTFRPDRLAALARVFARIDTITSRPSNRPGGGPAFVAFNPGESVGDWRDSNEGNGGGRVPLDVSAYLVPSALEAISALSQNPKFPKEALLAQAGADRARVAKLLDPKVLAARREDWRRASKAAFEVKLDGKTATRRITGALAAMPKDEAQAFGSLHLFNSKATLADALAPGSTALAGGVHFSGIALDEREKVIPVQSSDSAFDFFYGRPSKEELLDEVRTVFQPYPLGLMTPVGVAAANPAFSNRPQDAELFGRGKYHGGVVWGWQQPMMKQGLEKQLAYFKGDPEVESTVNEALRLLDRAERTVGGVGQKAEAWAWRADGGKIVPVPYGASATDATEANNSQLWTVAGSLGSGAERRAIPAEVKVRPTAH